MCSAIKATLIYKVLGKFRMLLKPTIFLFCFFTFRLKIIAFCKKGKLNTNLSPSFSNKDTGKDVQHQALTNYIKA